MFYRHRTKGIILKKDDWKEADRFFTVYTKEFGKIKVLGRGIRKIASKLKSGMETFYFSELAFIQGKHYKTLVDAVLVEDFQKIRSNLKKTVIAYRMLRIFNGLVQGQQKNEKMWQLLLESLRDLNNKKDYRMAYYYFLWNFLSLLGYTLNLYRCSNCQNKLKYKKNYLNLREGGIVCSECLKSKEKAQMIDPDLIKILRVILKDKEKAFTLKISKKNIKLLKKLSKNYLSLFLNQYE